VGLIAALSINASEAAKATKKKTEKVEYLRAAGSEPPPAPVRQVKKNEEGGAVIQCRPGQAIAVRRTASLRSPMAQSRDP
jgi:hypothetical protein